MNDLIGKVSFIDVFMSQAFGRKFSEVERRHGRRRVGHAHGTRDDTQRYSQLEPALSGRWSGPESRELGIARDWVEALAIWPSRLMPRLSAALPWIMQ